jgi:NADH-quinone oxidoreductase subunit I
MNALRKIGEDVLGLWSLVKGLKITGTYFFSKQVTVHYPRACVDNLALSGAPRTCARSRRSSQPLCIACMTCASTCPTGAISVVKKKAPKPDEGRVENQDGQKGP